MLIERIYDEDLAQAAYFIGCQATGEAIVVDGRRDVEFFQEYAAKNNMAIKAVTETHIHADYLSGTRELAEATGAKMYVSGEGGQDWQYGFEAERLNDGDTITVGNLTLEAVHTPGHTPEHLSFLLTDGGFTDEPGFLLSGDFVFVGDLGRPDLLDEAAGGVDTRFQGAKDLFRSLKEKFMPLPDYIQVMPAHGSGSACGKALGAVPTSTVGYEKAFAWWAKHVKNDDEQGFIDELLDGQPDAHAYFGRMKRENRDGPKVMGGRQPLTELDLAQVAKDFEAGKVVIADTRTPDEIHDGTVKGALAIPANKPATYGAWSYDPEAESTPIVLLAPDAAEAQRIWDHLVRVGIDDVSGYITSLDTLADYKPEVIFPAELDHTDYDLLLDVRNKTEHAEGHIPGSAQLNVGRLLWNLDELPADGTIVSYCQSGMRNTVAAQALRRAGYEVIEIDGSFEGWSNWKRSATA